ncbi:unnamed protein product [Adineta ricciae]|uniref:NHL repeat containing protein n=2 Tax=Adineta ricciae TaxID=249248 RepID=A0A815UZ49_ADIRI|nr:unnamed protein product [Adineta ricciae]
MFIWQLFVVISMMNEIDSQGIFHSQFVLTNLNKKYIPVNFSAQILSITLTSTSKLCALACNQNIMCSIFDYEVFMSNECRLFEGDIDTVGSIDVSSSPQSIVGIVKLSSELFAQYGQSCSSNHQPTRYLICGNDSTYQCIPHSYWNALISMCKPQLPILGAKCSQNTSMCRTDLNLICLPFKQCGPYDLLIGTTIAGYDNTTNGVDAQGLGQPRGIYILPLNNTLFVGDSNNCRVQRFDFGSRTGTTVAGGTGCGSNLVRMSKIWSIFVDNDENIYVGDYNNERVALWLRNASQSVVVANEGKMDGVTLDQYGNLYTAVYNRHVILRNNNTVVAGVYNVNGNSTIHLDAPRGIFFDKNTSSIFVCDTRNHRIQQFHMNSSIGITVAGGNGAGLGPHQLDSPIAVWVSSKTGYIYIADTNNHRVQRWKLNDTEGVTIAGTGIAGQDSTMFNATTGLTLNSDETYLYVSDQNNNRVQRFKLLV